MEKDQLLSNLYTKQIQHLGIVADVIEQMGIVDYIDKKLTVSKEKGAKTTMGQPLAAMILNGLGFCPSPLYIYPDYFKDKAVGRLLGEGVKAEHFNDDTLGRSLDAIYHYGIEKLFAELSYRIALKHNLLGKSAHLDTSSLSL